MNTAVLPMVGDAYKVKGTLLLSLYLIIPFCFFVAGIDYFIYGGDILTYWLPNNPSELIIWAVIFNFPHIVSSMVTLADKEYLSFYKKKLIVGLAVIVSVVISVDIIMPMIFRYSTASSVYLIFFVLFSVYTMHHVLSQQFGIGMMFMRVARNWQFESWRWLATIASTLMYLVVFGKYYLADFSYGAYSGMEYAQAVAGIFVILAIVQGVIIARKSQSRLGTLYVYSNLAMLLATYTFLFLDYQIFVIVIPRFVHDITAFIIYSVHDQNRNADVKRNMIYRWLSFLPLSPLLLCPLLAIFLANSIQCGTYMLDVFFGFNPKGSSECVVQHFYAPERTNGMPFMMMVGLQVVFIVALFHYYIEGFVWRRESIHRHSVKFDAS